MRASRLLRVVPGTVRPASVALVIAAMVACADYMTAPSDSTKIVRQPRAIKLSSANVAMLVGNQTTIVATILDQMGQPMDPAPSTAHVTWKSSDSTRARVDGSGVVTALHAGNVTVSAALASDLGPIAVSTSVGIRGRVTKLVLLGGGAQSGTVGAALATPVSVRLLDNAGDPMPGMWIRFAGGAANGSAAPDSVATDSSGAAAATWTLGQHAGIDTLSVNAGDSTGTASVLVTATAQAGPAAQAHLTPASLSFGTLGRTAKVTVAYKDRFGNPTTAPATTPAFSSSAVGVATVDQSGSVKAVGNGSAAITMSGMASDTVAVTVRQVVAALTLKAPSPVQAGSATQLNVTAADSGGAPVSDAQITWALSPAGAGNIDATGIFHPVKTGTDTIRATTSGISATAVVQVTAGAPAHIVAVSGDNQSAAAGATLGAPIVVRVTDANANVVQGATVTFSDASGGSAAPAAASTDLGGQASTQWTLSSNRAAVPALVAKITGDSVTFHATISGGGGHVPLGVTRTWTDSLNDGLWTTAGDWKPVGVPAAGDTVSIVALNTLPFHGTHSPDLTTSTTIAALTMQSGQSMSVESSDTLAVSGDVTGKVGGSGVLRMTGSGVHASGSAPTLLVGGSVTLAGAMTADSAVLAGGMLTLGGNWLTVHKFTADSASGLVMNNAADHVNATGNVMFYRTPERGRLTAGSIQVANGYLQGFYLLADSGSTDFYAPPAVQFTLIQGYGKSAMVGVDGRICDCPIAPMTLGTTTVKGDAFTTLAVVGRVNVSGKLALTNSALVDLSMGTLTVADSTIVSSAAIGGGRLVANGPLSVNQFGGNGNPWPGNIGTLELHHATGTSLIVGTVSADELDLDGANQLLGPEVTASVVRINGSAKLNANAASGSDAQVYGSLDLNGHKFEVGRTLNVTGTLLMTHPADSLVVHGDLGMFAQPTSRFTDGTLVVASSNVSKVFFGQAPSIPGNYTASGHHTFHIRHMSGLQLAADSIFVASNDHVSTFHGFTVDTNEVAYLDDPTIPAHGTFTVSRGATLALSATNHFTADTLVFETAARLLNNQSGYIGWCASYSAAPTATITGTAPVSACGNGGGGGQLAGVTRTWTDSTNDGLWTTAGNWRPVGVPAASDTVLVVPLNTLVNAGTHSPDLNTNSTIAALTTSSQQVFIELHDTLTVTGDVNATTAHPGIVRMTGTNAHLAGTSVANLLVAGGAVTLGGTVGGGTFTLRSGRLTLGGHALTVNSLSADSASALVMNSASDILTTSSSLMFNRTPERGNLTAGLINVQGGAFYPIYEKADAGVTDFYAPAVNFYFRNGAATISSCGTCDSLPWFTVGSVYVVGTSGQAFSMRGRAHVSGKLVVTNASLALDQYNGTMTVADSTIVGSGDIEGNTLFANGPLKTTAYSQRQTLPVLHLLDPSGTTLAPGVVVSELDMDGGSGQLIGPEISSGFLNVNGYTKLSGHVAADYVTINGSLDMNGQRLDVSTNFTQKGTLQMTHAADTIMVHRDVTFLGRSGTQLTDGAFIVASTNMPSHVYIGQGSTWGNYIATFGGNNVFHIRHIGAPIIGGIDSIFVSASDANSTFQNFAVDSGEVVYLDNPTALVNGTMTLGTYSNVILGPNNAFSADALVLQDHATLMNGWGGKIGYCTSYVVAPTASVSGTPPVHSCGVVPARAPVP